MKLIVDIPDTQYNNIMDFKMLCLGRIPYKGIIRHSIIAIQNGIPLDDLRAEIFHLHDWAFDRDEVLKIIDKYREGDKE